MRLAALPGIALLDKPHLTAVVVTPLCDPRGINCIEKTGLVTEGIVEPGFGARVNAYRYPRNPVGLFSGTALVTDTGHLHIPDSPYSSDPIKIMPDQEKSINKLTKGCAKYSDR